MSIDTALIDLIAQNNAAVALFESQRSSVAQLITDAVAVSVNEAKIPLVSMARNLIDTQTLLITLITKG
jgi:hypothetical protein